MPNPKPQRCAPVLSVNNRTMQPMIEFLVDRLGFQIDTVLRNPLAFAMLCRDENTVMLACRPSILWPHKGWAIYFWVDDVDAITTAVKDYGCKEIEVTTPDGRDIVFGQTFL